MAVWESADILNASYNPWEVGDSPPRADLNSPKQQCCICNNPRSPPRESPDIVKPRGRPFARAVLLTVFIIALAVLGMMSGALLPVGVGHRDWSRSGRHPNLDHDTGPRQPEQHLPIPTIWPFPTGASSVLGRVPTGWANIKSASITGALKYVLPNTEFIFPARGSTAATSSTLKGLFSLFAGNEPELIYAVRSSIRSFIRHPVDFLTARSERTTASIFVQFFDVCALQAATTLDGPVQNLASTACNVLPEILGKWSGC
ncbi:hypothetical protein QBC39DRAFT_362233 [Podospora conica]|nr:hypothetical protein QBC39DRAFT_362233 [Schizothecium conicum]